LLLKEAPKEANQTVHFVENSAEEAPKLQELPTTASSKEEQSRTYARATKLGLLLSVATTGLFLDSSVRALAAGSINVEGSSDLAAENTKASNSSETSDRDRTIVQETTTFRLTKLASRASNREIRDAESLWRLPSKYQIQLESGKPKTLLSSSKTSMKVVAEAEAKEELSTSTSRILSLKKLEEGNAEREKQALDRVKTDTAELSTKFDFATKERSEEKLPTLLLEKHTVQQEQAKTESSKINEQSTAETSLAKLDKFPFKEEAIKLDRPILLPTTSTEFLKEKEDRAAQTEVKEEKLAEASSERELSQPLVLSVAENPSYQVRSGDTIASIANKYGISQKELLKANKITNPKLLKADRKIEIPGTYVAAADSSQEKSLATKMPKIEVASAPVAIDTAIEQPKKVELAVASTSSEEIDIQAQLEANNVYVEKLKADVDRLQEEYHDDRELGVEITKDSDAPTLVSDVSENIFSSSPQFPLEQKQTPTLYADSRIKKESVEPELEIDIEDKTKPKQSNGSDDNVATAPNEVDTNNYNPALQTPVGKPVSPSIPPLSSPDRYLPESAPTFNGYIWPAKGVLTSGYGWRWGRMHKGIDIGAPIGTPIFASASGEVISAGWNSGGYGNLVKVKHANGSITFYAHNSKILVRTGEIVEQGQQIAALGNTGRSTGPHLHFEVRPDGQKAANPIAFLPKKK
jgi:murein DD-endopeptidase MepM/ murein hydrolase activator NlpD